MLPTHWDWVSTLPAAPPVLLPCCTRSSLRASNDVRSCFPVSQVGSRAQGAAGPSRGNLLLLPVFYLCNHNLERNSSKGWSQGKAEEERGRRVLKAELCHWILLPLSCPQLPSSRVPSLSELPFSGGLGPFSPSQDTIQVLSPWASLGIHTAKETSPPGPLASPLLRRAQLAALWAAAPRARSSAQGSSSCSSAPDILVLFKYLQQTVVKKIEA